MPTAPVIAPGGLSGQNTSSTSLIVWWTPLQANQNGVIMLYTVYYSKTDAKENSRQSIQVNSPAHQANITDLAINTAYTISVSASTKAGEGPMSHNITVETAISRELCLFLLPIPM